MAQFRLITVVSFLLYSSILFAQITGQVKDLKTGKFLSHAEVFLDGGLIRTFTDENGYFNLDGLQPGTFKIGCVKKGYEPIYKKVVVSPDQGILLFMLKPDAGPRLRDKQARKNIVSKISARTNSYFHWDSLLQVKSTDLKISQGTSEIYGSVEFENKALGYGIRYHLLTNNHESGALIQFFPLTGTVDDELRWENNRLMIYQLGLNNFLEAVLQHTSSIQGYTVYDERNQQIDLREKLRIGFSGEHNEIQLNQKIKVSALFGEQVLNSWIEANTILFTDDGLVLNQDSVKLEGTFAGKSLVNQLPVDYTPALERKHFKLGPYFEKAYVHTDKAYYYPGDTLWFKAYMNYKTLSLIESLSKVLIVELIASHTGGRIIAEKRLKIEDGEAWGEFVIPDSLSTPFIALRAYTNWQLNYNREHVFIRFLPLVKRELNLRNMRNEILSNHNARVFFSKPLYDKREKIRFTIAMRNDENKLISAWMSISVTDRSMVRMLNDTATIDRSYPIQTSDEPVKITYPLERGLNLHGQFFNERNKPTKAKVALMAEKLSQGFDIETDALGKFSILGLEFFDSARFVYSVLTPEGNHPLYGKIEIQTKTPLPVTISWPEPVDFFERADFKIEKNTTLLKEVIVQANRLAETEKKKKDEPKVVRRFGEPNYKLEGNMLNTGAVNVFEMMRGKVPGLSVTNNGADYTIRFTRASTISSNSQPLIIIDDNIMGGPIQQNMFGLIPADIASIEFFPRLVSITGDLGANGLIAIYTKAGGLRGRFQDDESVKTFTLNGFASPARFSGIDHSKTFMPPNSDFRTTLLWAPSVIFTAGSGPAVVEFYASDSTGPYLVTIEGVTADGKPFRDERLIEINAGSQ